MTTTLAIEQVHGDLVLVVKGPERCEVYPVPLEPGTFPVPPLGYPCFPRITIDGQVAGKIIGWFPSREMDLGAFRRAIADAMETERRRREGLDG